MLFRSRNTANTYDLPVSNPGSDLANRIKPKGWTPQLGILYQPTKEISLFAVQSLSIKSELTLFNWLANIFTCLLTICSQTVTVEGDVVR